jgi:adenosylhomocysteine nucleosidase
MRTRLGIVSALREELRELEAALDEDGRGSLGGLAVRSGRLDGHPVALTACGIGKVNAAIAATLLCATHGCGALVLLGVAGGIDASLEVGDLVVADRVVDADYGRATDEGRVRYRPGAMPLPHVPPGDPTVALTPGLGATVRAALPGLRLSPVALRPGEPPRAPAVRLGTIATTDAFVASELVRDALGRETGALAVEMEGAAIAVVAERFGVPWLVVRAVSDRAGTDSGLDFQAFLAAASSSAAELVRQLLPVVAGAVDRVDVSREDG